MNQGLLWALGAAKGEEMRLYQAFRADENWTTMTAWIQAKHLLDKIQLQVNKEKDHE